MVVARRSFRISNGFDCRMLRFGFRRDFEAKFPTLDRFEAPVHHDNTFSFVGYLQQKVASFLLLDHHFRKMPSRSRSAATAFIGFVRSVGRISVTTMVSSPGFLDIPGIFRVSVLLQYLSIRFSSN